MSYFGACTILPWYNTTKEPYIAATDFCQEVRFLTAPALPQSIVHIASRGKTYSLYTYALKVGSTCPTTAGSKNKLEAVMSQLVRTDTAFQALLLSTGDDLIIFREKDRFWGRWRSGSTWQGRNEMGELLMSCRDAYRRSTISEEVISPFILPPLHSGISNAGRPPIQSPSGEQMEPASRSLSIAATSPPLDAPPPYPIEEGSFPESVHQGESPAPFTPAYSRSQQEGNISPLYNRPEPRVKRCSPAGDLSQIAAKRYDLSLSVRVYVEIEHRFM